jgi:hypothetical protein
LAEGTQESKASPQRPENASEWSKEEGGGGEEVEVERAVDTPSDESTSPWPNPNPLSSPPPPPSPNPPPPVPTLAAWKGERPARWCARAATEGSSVRDAAARARPRRACDRTESEEEEDAPPPPPVADKAPPELR